MISLRAPALALALGSLLAGCGSNPYGFAHSYQPTDEERPHLERSARRSYEDVRRTRPEQQEPIAWFGVVLEPPAVAADGTATVHLSLRVHRERHLCESTSAETCRVTVSTREVGRFVAHLPRLRPEERDGELRIWTGSLLRVYGTPTGEEDGANGPIVPVDWYRHWPQHYYVTTTASGSMRQ